MNEPANGDLSDPAARPLVPGPREPMAGERQDSADPAPASWSQPPPYEFDAQPADAQTEAIEPAPDVPFGSSPPIADPVGYPASAVQPGPSLRPAGPPAQPAIGQPQPWAASASEIPGSAQPDPAQPDSAQPGAYPAGTYLGGAQAGAYPSGPNQLGPSESGSGQSGSGQPGPSQSGSGQPGPHPASTNPPGTFQPGTYPPGAYPSGTYPPAGAYPPAAYPPGAYPPGTYPAGAYQPGAYPAGGYPPGGYPPGGYAPGAYPAGAYPPGAYPPGAYPPGPTTTPPSSGNPAYGQSSGTPYGQPSGIPYGQPSGIPAYGQPSGIPAYGQSVTYPAYGQPGTDPAYGPPGYPPPAGPPGTYPPASGYAQQLPASYVPTAYPPYPAGGAYNPNASLNYYFPNPTPPRRGRTVAIISAVVVVLVLCAGAIYGYAQISGDPGPSTVAAPTGASTPKSTLRPPTGDNPATVDGMLGLQAFALLSGDEKAWLAPVDPHATSAIAAYKRIYHNMRAMHVAVWDQVSAGGDTITESSAQYEVDVTYCLVVKTCTDTEALWHISAKLVNGKALIEGYTAPPASLYTSEPYPWEVATLSALTGPRVVVAADDEAAHLPGALPIAERAAKAADQYAHWGKPAVYIVYLASHSEGKSWFDGGLRNADGVSYPIQPNDIEVTILMPDATEVDYAGPGGLSAVIQHEMGHVATLHGDTQDRGHDSFIEGIAEYCSYTGHTSWASLRLENVHQYIADGDWSHSIYMTSQITGKSVLAGSAAYGIGYLGLRYLVSKYGLTAMLNFWGDFERDGKSLNTSAEDVFHKSWTSVDASAATYVEHAVGL